MKALLRSALFLSGLIIVLELFFTFVMPACRTPQWAFKKNGVRLYDTHEDTDGFFTYTRYCRGHFHYSINNRGWNSIFDYEEADQREHPMIALFGDSYIEGFFSPVEQHIDRHLTDLSGNTLDFYTFGMSGGFISQYIAWMELEATPLDPEAYVLFVNKNDVIMSLTELSHSHPYYFQYLRDDDGKLVRTDPHIQQRSKVKDLMKKSAFIRYLKHNVQIDLFGKGMADDNNKKNRRGKREEDSQDLDPDLVAAADFLLQELSRFDKPVLLVGDCPKEWIYEGAPKESFDDILALRQLVDGYPEVTLIELGDHFPRGFARDGLQFSVPDNTHWNAYANSFIAEVIYPEIQSLLAGGGEGE